MSPRRRRRRSTPTPAQIWRILNATAREARIARRELAEERRRNAKLDEQRKAEAAVFAKALAEETAARTRETAARTKETAARAAALAEEFRRKDAERDRVMERELYRIRGDGDNRWGTLIEALVEGNLLKLLRDANVDVLRVFSGVRSRIYDTWREYDLVAVGDGDAVVVEVKTTLRAADVERFTERIGDFREWRPDHARPRVRGALAYLTAKGNAEQAAEAAGFYLIRAVTGSARLVNSDGFRPRVF